MGLTDAHPQFPNLNLLPPELAKPLVTSLRLLLAIFLAAEIVAISFLLAQVHRGEETKPPMLARLGTLNQTFQENAKNQDQAAQLTARIALLEEMPKAYVQLVSSYDLSALQQKLLENAPPGLKLTDLRGRGASVTLQGTGDPEVILNYYQRLRKLTFFSSVILKFLAYPETPPEGSFLIELTVR